MSVTLEEVKSYLRIEPDFVDDDYLLQLMIDNANIYLNNLVTIDETNLNMVKQATLIILILVADMYDNRNLIADKTSEKTKYIVNSILNQLSYCYGVEVI